MLQLYVWILYEPYNSTITTCNYIGGQLLLLYVRKLHEPHNSTITTRNYIGEWLL